MPKLKNIIKEADIVFVHKDENLITAFLYLARPLDKTVETYHDPQTFLNNISQYPKHTKIVVGRTFNSNAYQGIQIARQLHAVGFTRLYLVVIFGISKEPMPDYLTVINLKFDDLREVFLDN